MISALGPPFSAADGPRRVLQVQRAGRHGQGPPQSARRGRRQGRELSARAAQLDLAGLDRRAAGVGLGGGENQFAGRDAGVVERERAARAGQWRGERHALAVGVDADRLAGGRAEAAGIVGVVRAGVLQRAAAENDGVGGIGQYRAEGTRAERARGVRVRTARRRARRR